MSCITSCSASCSAKRRTRPPAWAGAAAVPWPARARHLPAHLRSSRTALPPHPRRYPELLRHGFIMAMVVALGWFVVGCIYVLQAFMLRRYDISVANNVRARRIHTQFQVFRRMLITFVVVIDIGALLWTFNDPAHLALRLRPARLRRYRDPRPRHRRQVHRLQLSRRPADRADRAHPHRRCRRRRKASGAGSKRSPRPMSSSRSGTSAASSFPLTLLHRKLLRQLDPRVRRHSRHRIPLRRLLHSCRRAAQATRRHRSPCAPVGQEGMRPAGHQSHRAHHGDSLPRQLHQLQRKLRSALPDPRKDDRLDSAELSQRLPHHPLRRAVRLRYDPQDGPISARRLSSRPAMLNRTSADAARPSQEPAPARRRP